MAEYGPNKKQSEFSDLRQDYYNEYMNEYIINHKQFYLFLPPALC